MRAKTGPKPRPEEERRLQAEIREALCKKINEQRYRVERDMKGYWSNHKRLGQKARAAHEAGMSYGYYVAFVLEKRGRLYWKRGEKIGEERAKRKGICNV